MGGNGRWASLAIARLDAEADDTPPTPLRAFPLPASWNVSLWLKDESALPTGSLKHRAARAMFRHAIASGRIVEGTTVVEATAGNAAISQAYFARMLGLPYVAVMPETSTQAAAVENLGGRCEFVTPALAIYDAAQRLADAVGGHYLNQFAAAERAIDWRADDLATELFDQVIGVPDWVVVGAGTGATSASLGRHIRYHGKSTQLAVVDPENSAYFPGWASGAADYATGAPSRIDGIGRPRMEPGFVPHLVDLVMPVPDAASIAAARAVRTATGLPVGGSTGANLWGSLHLVAGARDRGRPGIVVSLICDAADRHLPTIHDDAWAFSRGLDPGPYVGALQTFLDGGPWS